MKITVSVTVPDYVYLFYQKASETLPQRTPQELMAQALTLFAGTVSEKILLDKKDS